MRIPLWYKKCSESRLSKMFITNSHKDYFIFVHQKLVNGILYISTLNTWCAEHFHNSKGDTTEKILILLTPHLSYFTFGVRGCELHASFAQDYFTIICMLNKALYRRNTIDSPICACKGSYLMKLYFSRPKYADLKNALLNNIFRNRVYILLKHI